LPLTLCCEVEQAYLTSQGKKKDHYIRFDGGAHGEEIKSDLNPD
jgi:hypothetical protein